MRELLKGALIDLSSSTILEVLLQKQSYLYAKFPKRSFPKFKAVEASQCICDINKKVHVHVVSLSVEFQTFYQDYRIFSLCTICVAGAHVHHHVETQLQMTKMEDHLILPLKVMKFSA